MNVNRHYFYIVIMFFSYLSLESGPNDNILLIINYNFPYYNSIDFLTEIYLPYFPNIVFIGPEPDSRVEYIEHYKGYFGYKGISHILKKYPDYDGYLYINDDSIINCWNFDRFDRSKVWCYTFYILSLTDDIGTFDKWYWWKTKWGLEALMNAYSQLPKRFLESLSKNLGKNVVSRGLSDVVYFPSRLRQDVIFLAEFYAQHDLFLEIAIPLICCSLSKQDEREILNGLYLWKSDREKIFNFYNSNLDFIHPVKLSNDAHKAFIAKQYSMNTTDNFSSRH